jgi:hypothetical protein
MRSICHRAHRDDRRKPYLVFSAFSVAILLLFFSSCSIPNLEKPECTESRDRVKQFYSLYLGTDAQERKENWDRFQKFFAPGFSPSPNSGGPDPFTLSTDWPTTFKIGECKVIASDKTDLQVQLYWRTDPVVVQKEVHVEAVKTNDTWMINKIGN